MHSSSYPSSSLKNIHRGLLASASGILALVIIGCGKPAAPAAPEPKVETQPPRPAASTTPETTPESEPVPETEPMSSPEPTPVPPPSPAADTISEPLRQIWVATAFQSESEYGTHDFPVGAQVNLLAIEGEEYLVEYEGVSVKNHRSFFSETLIEKAPVEAAPEATPTPEPEPLSPPTPPAPDALSDVQTRTEQISEKIREIDEKIRANDREAIQQGTGQGADASVQRKNKSLKKERDALSEELTEFSKP